MAQSGRFALALKVLAVLAGHPGEMLTSAAIGDEVGSSAVMVRRTFLLLQRAGWLVQRKGPHGGAQLKVAPKSIGVGDVFAVVNGAWLDGGDPRLEAMLKKARGAAVGAMNETTVAQVGKRIKRG